MESTFLLPLLFYMCIDSVYIFFMSFIFGLWFPYSIKVTYLLFPSLSLFLISNPSSILIPHCEETVKRKLQYITGTKTTTKMTTTKLFRQHRLWGKTKTKGKLTKYKRVRKWYSDIDGNRELYPENVRPLTTQNEKVRSNCEIENSPRESDKCKFQLCLCTPKQGQCHNRSTKPHSYPRQNLTNFLDTWNMNI